METAVMAIARGEELFLQQRSSNRLIVAVMTLNIFMVAGDSLALAVSKGAARVRRSRPGIITEQVSGDWLAQARAREEHPW